MSIRILNQVWTYAPYAKEKLLVLLSLADFADDNGACYPSMVAIADKARTTERGARLIIRQFEADGVISTTPGYGRGKRNHYQINFEAFNRSLNPEAETRNEKPGMRNRESHDPKRGNGEAQKGERGSSAYRKNRHEPSIEKYTDTIVSDDARASRAGLVQHPTIQLVRRIANRYPHKSLYAEIIALLGDEVDEVRLAECHAAWVKRGYNPSAWTWLFDWYKGGIPETNNGQNYGQGRGYVRETTESRRARELAEFLAANLPEKG